MQYSVPTLYNIVVNVKPPSGEVLHRHSLLLRESRTCGFVVVCRIGEMNVSLAHANHNNIMPVVTIGRAVILYACQYGGILQ